VNEQISLHQLYNDSRWAATVRLYEQTLINKNLEDCFERPGGIHGVRHAKRVLYHVLILSELCKVVAADRRLLIQAALYHDIGRERDGLCYVHGGQSVKKMKRLGLFPTEKTEGDIMDFIVSYHCIADEAALIALDNVDGELQPRILRLFKILKDADGLDRVRINDLDPKFLRNSESLRLEALAYELFAAI